MKNRIDLGAVHAQLCNELEAERAALRVYELALPLATPRERVRWAGAQDEAQRSERALLSILADLQLDPECDSVQRRSVRSVGDALLHSLHAATGLRDQAEIARECVRIVQQRERSNWLLLGQLLSGAAAQREPRREARSARKATLRPGWLDRAAHFRLRPRHAPALQAG